MNNLEPVTECDHLEPVNSRKDYLSPRAKIGDVVTPSNSVELNSHVHEWRTFKRKDNAIPLWIDCLSCNAREVKASLRGTYSRYQFTLPIEERDHNKQVTYTK